MSVMQPRPPAERARPRTFSRKATGLVRAASLKDVLAFNINMQNVFIGALFALLLIPPLYPQANIYLATLIALVISLPVSWVYAKLAGVFPRSGGDYVYVSRVIHPAIGFMSNLSYCIWGMFYVGVAGVFLGVYGVAPLLRVIGAYTESGAVADAGNWFAEPLGQFVMAVGLIGVFTAIFVFGGLRLYFRVQAVNFTIASLALLALVIWGFVASRAGALGNVEEQLSNIGGQGVAALGQGSPEEGFSLKQTVFAAIWPWLAFNSAIYSTYMGGEVKQADRNQVLGIMGALLWAGAWTLLVIWSMFQVFGEQFWANLGNADPAELGLSTTPTLGEVTGYALGSALPAIVIMFGLALWTYVWIAPYTVLVTRSALAWSLDRLGPAKLAEVHPRWHSPVWALVTVAIVGCFTSGLYAFGELSVLTGTIGLTASMIVVAVAGILLPYRQRDLWASSPARGRWGSVPIITVVGVVAIPLLLVMEWALIADENSGASLSANPGRLAIVVAIFLVGLPLYYVIRAVQRRRGIDVDLAFKEIPPE